MCRVKKQPTRGDLSPKATKTKHKQRSEEYLKYRDYIRSKEFDEVRQMVKERDKCCQFCGRNEQEIAESPNISFNIHHRSYEHLFEGGEVEANDCILVCSVCHKAMHQAKSNLGRFKRNEK